MNSGWSSASGQRQRLLEQRKSRVAVAAVARGSPLAEQGHGQTGRFVAALAQEAHAERGQLGGGGMILPRQREHAGPVQGSRANRCGDGGARSAGPLQPRNPLRAEPADEPEPAQTGGEADHGLLVTLLVEPGERGADVVALGRESLEQLGLGRLEELGAQRLGERHEVLGVATSRGVDLARGRELLETELPDRLQHAEARVRAGCRHGPHQALVGEGGDPGEDVERAVVTDDRLRRLERPTAAEDGQPPKEGRLVPLQQVVAPGDGVAQGALPRRGVAWSTGEDGQAAFQPFQQGVRRQESDARRGELDGQRQPIEALADGGDGRRVVLGQREVGHDGPCSLHEEVDRRHAGELGQRQNRFGRRQGQGRHGNLLLGAHLEWFPARHQHGELRARRQQLGELRRRVEDLLEVVEHQEQPLRCQERLDGLQQPLPPCLTHPEDAGDRLAGPAPDR